MAATTNIHLPAESLLDETVDFVTRFLGAVDQAINAQRELNAIAAETDSALLARGTSRANAIRDVAARCF